MAARDEQYLARRPDEPGIRNLDAVVPEGFAEPGLPDRDEFGRRLVPWITGNGPGRRDSGRIRGEGYTERPVEPDLPRLEDARLEESAPTVAPDVIRFLTRFALRVGATFGTLDLGGAYFFDEAPDVDTTGNEFCGSVHEPGVSPPP